MQKNPWKGTIVPGILRTLFLGVMITFGVISFSHGQGELPVNMFTGTPTVDVPLWTATDRDISVPVGLVYKADGLRVNEPAGPVGIGWWLAAGSSVAREVRGLPDDFTGSAGTADHREGWIFTGSGPIVQALGNTADLSASTCTDETNDYNTIHALQYLRDSEPDIFSYSVEGASGQFVINPSNGAVHLMPYQDVQITYEGPMEGNAPITSFTIKTNTGYTYTFDKIVMVRRWTKKATDVDVVRYQQRFFNLYDIDTHGIAASYAEEWKLTKIQSPMRATMTLEYKTFISKQTEEPVKIGLRQNASDAVQEFIPYTIFESRSQTEVSAIHGLTSGTDVTFSYTKDTRRLTSVVVRDTRGGGDGLVKNFELKYIAIRSGGTAYKRDFLFSVREYNGCDALPPYKFTYIGVDYENDRGQTANSTTLPPPGSTSVDAWGYYNGKSNTSLFPKLYVYPDAPAADRYRLEPIPNYANAVFTLAGADRSVGDYAITIGSLSTVSYPAGGSMTLIYEPNTYFDEIAQRSYRGGGLRVKYTVYFDGMNPQNNIIKEFKYEDTSGKSWGRLLHRPAFAFPLSAYRDPANQSMIKTYSTLATGGAEALWQHLTARTQSDLVPMQLVQGSAVGYKTVQVARTGMGRAVHEFDFPGVAGDVSHETDWVATVNKFVRSTSCPSLGVVSAGSRDAFPHAPSPSYSYRQGLPLKKTEFNEAGAKVREIIMTYQPLYKSGSSPFKLWGLYYDAYANGDNTYFFGKYYEVTDVNYTVATETTNVYDEANTNKVLTTATAYYHDSPYHKLLTRTSTTNSDGTTLKAKMKYAPDYVIPDGADKAAEMLVRLRNGHRHGIPIETILTQQKQGDSEKVVSASILKFDDFGSNMVLPQYIYELRAIAPLASFAPSDIPATTKAFTIDPAYEVTNTYLAYDVAGNTLSARGEDRLSNGIHWGYNNTLPTATISGATHGQVAFSDFETATGRDFTSSTALPYGAGRTGARAWYPQGTISQTVSRGDAKQFVFSYWAKKSSAAVNLQLVIRPAAGGSSLYSQQLSVTPATSAFEYYERVIDVSTFPSSFVVEVQGSLSGVSPGFDADRLPVVDDIAFYPAEALLSSTTYSMPFGVSSVTGADGTTTYTSRDKLGRVTLEYDQDHNIRRRTTYTFAAMPVTLSTTIVLPSPLWPATPLIFQAPGNSCIQGETYSWDFGDGQFTPVTTDSFIEKSFLNPGEYTVRVRVTHAQYGEVTSEPLTFTIVPKPVTISICAKGVYQLDNCGGGAVITGQYTLTCPNAGTPNLNQFETRFYAAIDTDDPIKSYQWYRHPINPGPWSWAKTVTTPVYSGRLVSPYQSYTVKCVIELLDGRKIESEEYAVYVGCGTNVN